MLLPLLTLCLLLFSFEVTLLFRFAGSVDFVLYCAVFPRLVEAVQGLGHQVWVQTKLIGVAVFVGAPLCFFLLAVVLHHATDFFRGRWLLAQFGTLLNELCLLELLGLLDLATVLCFINIKSVHEQLNVFHVVDAERFANRINLNRKLLLQRCTLATFVSAVVNQVVSFGYEELKDLLNPVILIAGLACSLRLVLRVLRLGVELGAGLVWIQLLPPCSITTCSLLVAIQHRSILLNHAVSTLSG